MKNLLFPIAIGLLLGFLIPLPSTQAQGKPFSVYRSGNACVYVAGGNGGPVDIEIIPVKELFLGSNGFPGC